MSRVGVPRHLIIHDLSFCTVRGVLIVLWMVCEVSWQILIELRVESTSSGVVYEVSLQRYFEEERKHFLCCLVASLSAWYSVFENDRTSP